jgi:hypothetical protein
MPIILNHTIVPARDKVAAARFFADTFGLDFNEQQSGHFAPVRVNETLTLLFDEDTSFDSHHLCLPRERRRIRRNLRAHQEIHMAAHLGASMTASSMTGMAAEAFILRTRTVTCLS